jgi:hypothetical protein
MVIDLQGEELEGYFQFLKSRSSRMKRENFGDRRVENFAFFSQGILGVINVDPNKPANVGFMKDLQLYLIKHINVFSICKNPKHRQKKRR